jgi:hypothetical protein
MFGLTYFLAVFINVDDENTLFIIIVHYMIFCLVLRLLKYVGNATIELFPVRCTGGNPSVSTFMKPFEKGV